MSEVKKRKKVQKKRYWVPILIITLLIVGRILLPYFLERSVNKTLDDIPGYTGYVEDIDVALYRGAYVIEGLILKKENSKSETPILDFAKSDISIEWKSLFKGKIVSEIELHNPKFNYLFEEMQGTSEEEADAEDWTKALTDLVPIDINRLSAHQGEASFVQLSASPDISLYLKEINLEATNLSNVVNKEQALPSNLHATAISFGGGIVKLDGNLNLLKEIPDMDIDFSLEKADVTALNDLTKNVMGVDFESGTFELFVEAAIADGYLKGYIKPMFISTKLIGKDDEGGIFKKLWEGFVGVFKFILKNQGTDTLATRAPIEGDLNNIETGIWPTILNIFKNAWIEAFSGQVDKNIEFKDAENAREK